MFSSISRLSSPWIARLVAKGRGDRERRAEFQFVTDDNQNFEFLTLVGSSYDDVAREYRSFGQKRWPRFKWKVGIACDRFNKSWSYDRFGHWGVYVTKADTEVPPATATPFDIPVDVFKIYGFNWTNDGKGMQLEAVWKARNGEKRDLTKQEFQSIERDTEAVKSDQFGNYRERELYFSWPEFVLIAQFVLQEFAFEALGIPTQERHSKRATGGIPELDAKAYNLANRNCQDYCRMLLNKMSENQWGDPERLNYAFTLADLETEWRSKDNSWAKDKGWGQKQLVRSFVNQRGLELLGDDASDLKPLSTTDAKDLWTHLVLGQRSKSRHPRLSDDDDEALLSMILLKLDYCDLAIRMAAAYFVQKQITLREYLSQLTANDKALDQNEHARTWFHESRKRCYEQLIRGMRKETLRSVALVWLTSFRALEKMYDTPENSNPVMELLSFITCLSDSAYFPDTLVFTHSLTGHQEEDPASVLCRYAFLRIDTLGMHGMVYMLNEVWFQWVRQVEERTVLKAMDKIRSTFPSSEDDSGWLVGFTFHAKHVLYVGEKYDAKERSDLSFVLGQHLTALSLTYHQDSALRVSNAKDAIMYLKYTWRWRWEHSPDDAQDMLASMHALIEAYYAGRDRVEELRLKLIRVRYDIFEVHLKKLPEGLSGLLDARKALAQDHEAIGRTLDGKLLEKFKNIVAAEIEDLRSTDPLRLRAGLELGKVYLDNEEYRRALPVLYRVLEDGSDASARDKLWYVSNAMECLESVHQKLSHDDEAHEMRKKKNELYNSIRRGYPDIWEDWVGKSPSA